MHGAAKSLIPFATGPRLPVARPAKGAGKVPPVVYIAARFA
jgi:hypothetical protein